MQSRAPSVTSLAAGCSSPDSGRGQPRPLSITLKSKARAGRDFKLGAASVGARPDGAEGAHQLHRWRLIHKFRYPLPHAHGCGCRGGYGRGTPPARNRKRRAPRKPGAHAPGRTARQDASPIRERGRRPRRPPPANAHAGVTPLASPRSRTGSALRGTTRRAASSREGRAARRRSRCRVVLRNVHGSRQKQRTRERQIRFSHSPPPPRRGGASSQSGTRTRGEGVTTDVNRPRAVRCERRDAGGHRASAGGAALAT
jgi:hypothetical protein